MSGKIESSTYSREYQIMDELLKIILPPKPPESPYECEGCSA